MFFRFCMLLLMASAILTAFSPILSFNNILYPERIDSVSLRQEQLFLEKQASTINDSVVREFIFTPAQLNARFLHLSFSLPDKTVLRGWLVLDSMMTSKPLLVIIPDIEEGAISYLYTLKALADRGIHAAVIDLRAQGSSDGTTYQFTRQSAIDLKYFLNQMRKLHLANGISLFGNGTGAAAAMETAMEPGIINSLILRHPMVSLRPYLRRTARNQWGNFIKIFLPGMLRTYEKKAGIQLEDYDYRVMNEKIEVPELIMVSASAPTMLNEAAKTIYHVGESSKRKWVTDSTTVTFRAGLVPDKIYLDQVAAFVHGNAPVPVKKSRFRRLAFLPPDVPLVERSGF